MSRRGHRAGHSHKQHDKDRPRQSGNPPPQLVPNDGPRHPCAACGQPMSMAGGYGGTGLCGPCATGEADTLDDFGEDW